MKNDQGTVEYDQVQLGYCHIMAPIPGRSACGWWIPATWCRPAARTRLVVITQLQPITVIFTIAGGQPRPGGDADAAASASCRWRPATGRELTKLASGKLLTLDNQIDTTTGTVKLAGSSIIRTELCFPNQFVNTGCW